MYPTDIDLASDAIIYAGLRDSLASLRLVEALSATVSDPNGLVADNREYHRRRGREFAQALEELNSLDTDQFVDVVISRRNFNPDDPGWVVIDVLCHEIERVVEIAMSRRHVKPSSGA